MNTTLLVVVTMVNVVSLIAFIVVERETRHIIRSHVHILGQENEELVNTFKLKLIRFCHAAAVITVAVLSYLLFDFS